MRLFRFWRVDLRGGVDCKSLMEMWDSKRKEWENGKRIECIEIEIESRYGGKGIEVLVRLL